MRRLVSSAALVCALVLPCLAVPSAVPSAALAAGSHAAAGALAGVVTDVEGGTFTVQTAGRRMGVINALVAAANHVAGGSYPYVWGGGHAEAGVASVGIPGAGHNGRRVGFDCSGSVAAVLAGAGLWRWGAGVPNDAGVIAQLRSQGLIAQGAGRAPLEVTLYDDPGVHIFMNIDGRFFGTSDGGGGGNRHGGAGWLYDGAWDATDRAFKQYDILPGVLRDRTTYGHDFTFSDGAVALLASALAVGDRVRVGYAQNSAGGMTATTLSWAGSLTAAGTLISVAADGSSFQVQLADGQVLDLASSSPSLLHGAAVGDAVSVTYTGQAGTLTARALQVVGPATGGTSGGSGTGGSGTSGSGAGGLGAAGTSGTSGSGAAGTSGTSGGQPFN